MNEWTNDWMNEWMNERTSDLMKEWTNEQTNDWMNEWMNELDYCKYSRPTVLSQADQESCTTVVYICGVTFFKISSQDSKHF